MSEVQESLYSAIVAAVKMRKGGVATKPDEYCGNVLSLIQMLTKLSTHPRLISLSNLSKHLQEIWNSAITAAIKDPVLQERLRGSPTKQNVSRENRRKFSDENVHYQNGNVVCSAVDDIHMSGKLLFVFELLKAVKIHTSDRFVIVR